MQVAQWLQSRGEVATVFCPALPGHPGHALWLRDCTGTNGLISFELKKDFDKVAAERLIDGLALIFIAHDLAVVKHISDRILVMYLGHEMEVAQKKALYATPRHPYTQALLSAIPIPDPALERKKVIQLLHGDLPSPMDPPSGCVFRTRCPLAIERCAQEVPELRRLNEQSEAACLLA